FFFFQAEDGIRDFHVTGSSDVCSSDLTLRVKGSKRYRLSGADIETDLPISPWEAALGADVSVPTPGGPVTVHVPPGSSTGRRLRSEERRVGKEWSPRWAPGSGTSGARV